MGVFDHLVSCTIHQGRCALLDRRFPRLGQPVRLVSIEQRQHFQKRMLPYQKTASIQLMRSFDRSGRKGYNDPK